MHVAIRDPHPGRCKNLRRDEGALYEVKYRRCLEMDGHQSACRFPPNTKKLMRGELNYAGSIHAEPEPRPWVVPEPQAQDGE